MARRRIPIFAATLLLLVAVVPAAAADGCPAAASGFRAGAVDWDWELGDPVPMPGEDLLWDVTVVAGGEAEELTLQELAEVFGVDTIAELYEGVLEGWRGLDKNMDGAICFKAFSENGKGFPAYFSNFVDTNARAAK